MPFGSFNNLFLTTHAHLPSAGDMFIFPAPYRIGFIHLKQQKVKGFPSQEI